MDILVIQNQHGDTEQEEHQQEDTVKREYSLKRMITSVIFITVSYTADDHNGFNAVLIRSEPSKDVKFNTEIKTFIPDIVFTRHSHKI